MRHGESEANVAGVYSNRVNNKHPLTENGLKQAQKLAEVLQAESFIKLYTSPLLRAMQTAQILAQRLNLEIEPSAALLECDTGVLEEQQKTAVNTGIYAENEKEWFTRQNFDYRIERGESLNDVRNRFVPFVASLERRFGKQDVGILLVAHGSLYRAMFPIILKNRDFVTSHPNYMDHCEYIVSEVRSDGLHGVKWGNNTKL